MQTAALRHRPESEDCFLINKEQMKVRLHTGKDVKEVRVYYADVHEPLEKKRELSLTLAGHGQVQDYWEGTLTLPLHRAQYLFEVIGLDGKTVKEDVATLDTNDDTTTPLQALHVDDSYDLGGKNVYIVRLTLSDSNGKVLSTNTYVDSNDHGNLQDLNALPVLGENDIKVSVETVACKDAKKACCQAQAKGCSAQATGCNKSRRIITLENTSKTPAMMVRLNLLDGDGDQILPVDYSDNYFHLLPGEKRTIKVAWNNEDMRKGNPVVDVTGFNVK